MMAQYGVPRGLPGEYPEGYDDRRAPYTPAWQEQYGPHLPAHVLRAIAATREGQMRCSGVLWRYLHFAGIVVDLIPV